MFHALFWRQDTVWDTSGPPPLVNRDEPGYGARSDVREGVERASKKLLPTTLDEAAPLHGVLGGLVRTPAEIWAEVLRIYFETFA